MTHSKNNTKASLQTPQTVSSQKTHARASFAVHPVHLACMVLLATASSLSVAQQLTLTTVPVGTGGTLPAPNVILSIDDSGSMDWGANNESLAVDAITNPRKMTVLKDALTATFAGTPPSIPDGRIRLAWQSMWNNGSSPGAASLSPGAINTIKPLDATHRTNFLSFVTSLTPSQTTPSHRMVSQADTYMRNTSSNSPWRTLPGGSATGNQDQLACRRSYHIFLTDGAWNNDPTTGVGNIDGVGRTLPDGTVYDVANSNTQTRVYRDAFGGTPGTLADYAFRSWADDLQSSIANSVPPVIKKSGPETIGTTILQEYWNPKNDPATWQHLQTYTIGFGTSAFTWVGSPQWLNSTPPVAADNYAGTGYVNLVNGAANSGWQDAMSNTAIRPSELWHMALNGRGAFYPIGPGGSLTAAFSDILANVLADTTKPLTAISANSSKLQAGLLAFQAGYDGSNWSGKLTARPIDGTGAISATPVWDISTSLDATAYSVASRFVLTHKTTTSITGAPTSAGVPFKTLASLSQVTQDKLNANSSGTADAKGQDRLDYLRGDHTKEQSNTGGVYRNRGAGTATDPKKRLGDIANSNIWYLGMPTSGYRSADYLTFRSTGTGGVGNRTPMVYVGANDGMLHGFSAVDGTEKLAYIPQGVAEANLRSLADTNYVHKYFVDGHPYTGDAKIGSTPSWKTVLVSGLAGGGKGYFALDVSNPVNFTDANAANLVITDTTATTDPDIGYIFTTPVIDSSIPDRSQLIVKMNNGTPEGRWAAVFGNGYNSTNEAPVLLIQYLDGDKKLVKVSACPFPTSGACTFKGGNGLSTPRLIDLNGDGKMDVAYAGDLKGNVWKFDLTDNNDSAWKASFSKQPFFVAKPSATLKQAITTAPLWQDHPEGGIMLTVATGKNLEVADRSTTTTESVYGLWDNSVWGTVGGVFKIITEATPINTTASTSIPTSLVPQTFTGTLLDAGNTYYTQSSNPVLYTGAAAKRGYYYNWPQAGERVLENPVIYSGQKVKIYSMIPSSNAASNTETCTPTLTSDRRFQTINNGFTAAPPDQTVYDLTNPNAAGAKAVATKELGPGESIALTVPCVGICNGNDKEKTIGICPEGQVCSSNTTTSKGGFTGRRANWRQVQ